MQLSDIVTNNVREDELNTRLWYAMVRIDKIQNKFIRGVTLYKRFWRTMCYEWLDWIKSINQLDEYEMFIFV